jgi:hypothetical protein
MPIPNTIVQLKAFKGAVKAMQKLVIPKYVDRFDTIVPAAERLLGKTASKTISTFGRTRDRKGVDALFAKVFERIDVKMIKLKAAK